MYSGARAEVTERDQRREVRFAAPYTLFQCYACLKPDCAFEQVIRVEYKKMVEKSHFYEEMLRGCSWFSQHYTRVRDHSFSDKKDRPPCYYTAEEPRGIPVPEEEHTGYYNWTGWVCRDCAVECSVCRQPTTRQAIQKSGAHLQSCVQCAQENNERCLLSNPK